MRGVDGDRDSDLGEGRFSSGSENEEESGGGVEILTALPALTTHSVSEHVSTAAVPTSKSTRGRIRTPSVRMHINDGRAVSSGIHMSDFLLNTCQKLKSARFLPAKIRNRLDKKEADKGGKIRSPG